MMETVSHYLIEWKVRLNGKAVAQFGARWWWDFGYRRNSSLETRGSAYVGRTRI